MSISNYYKEKDKLLAEQKQERALLLNHGVSPQKIDKLHHDDYETWKANRNYALHNTTSFEYTGEETVSLIAYTRNSYCGLDSEIGGLLDSIEKTELFEFLCSLSLDDIKMVEACWIKGISQAQLVAMNAAKRTTEKRRVELERLIQSLYEDKVKGKIPEDVCARLISQYETERREQVGQAQIFTEQIESFKMEQSNTQEWIDVIRQYRNIETINRDILTKLINKIEVGERQIIGGQKQREIRIHYRFVGFIGYADCSTQSKLIRGKR